MHIRLLAAIIVAVLATPAHADDWMARLADSQLVCRLSIPGTHDAATGEGFVPADSLTAAKIATTQELPLARQWAAGIRAFDLRPDVMAQGDTLRTLQIYHGEFATRMSLPGALRLLRDSLQAHPTEFAIIIMQHERSASRDGSQWEPMVRQCLAAYSSMMVDFRPDLTVGDMRGHMLLLSRDTYAGQPYGGYVSGWRFDPDVDWKHPALIRGRHAEGHLVLQDFYDMTAEGGMPAKLRAINRLALISSGNGDMPQDPFTWFINHTSGYMLTTTEYGASPVSLSEGYRANAAKTNKAMCQIIASHGGHMRTGLVMMDFGGADSSAGHDVLGAKLTRAVINSNF